MQKVLILGVSGMLGHSAYWLFASSARVSTGLQSLRRSNCARIVRGIDISEFERLVRLFAEESPSIVNNCVGLIKQLPATKDPLASIAVNAPFSHRLAQLCAAVNARLIQISTDCVFNGRKGNYR